MTTLKLFTASYCGPCKAIKKRLKEEGLLEKIEVIDCMEFPTTAERYLVKSIPLLVIEEDGKEKERLIGAMITTEKVREYLS